MGTTSVAHTRIPCILVGLRNIERPGQSEFPETCRMGVGEVIASIAMTKVLPRTCLCRLVLAYSGKG